MHFLINGQSREFSLPENSRLENLIDALALKSDRVAVEYNGTIIARADWPKTPLANGDKIEIVHFVGGGLRAC
jgi:sulfur carrier protein